ncbi:MAG: hypothetical protein ACC645_11270 [Pirellulales bacterium]
MTGRCTAIDLGGPRLIDVEASSECRLVWWPDGLPTGRWTGVASSRLGRQFEARQSWFAALQSLCRAMDAANDWLVAVDATAAEQFVRRAAELFHRNVLSVDVCQQPNRGLEAWLRRVSSPRPNDRNGAVCQAYVGPPIGTRLRLDRQEDVSVPPARDRVLVLLADLLWVLHIRPGGHIERLVRRRLADPATPPASVIIAVGKGLVDRPLSDALLRLGAVPWQPESSTCLGPVLGERAQLPTVVPSLPHLVPWPYLIHTTRRCDGAWPDQEETDYLDDLILDRPAADHSPYATLERIVRQRKILASDRVIRGSAEVVSFTSAAPDELLRMRIYRPHRRRWDFQPYGLCIRRDWLAQRGTRPVYYGDERLWQRLPPTERPFFQRRRSPGTGRRKPLLWTVEREWRHVGDVDLSYLPPEAAWLFVPTDAEAHQLGAISPWPVGKLAPAD